MASLKVVGSGTVTPDPTTSNRSPITSDIIIVITGVGRNFSANWPPFTSERCLRMVFISFISAPDSSNSRVAFCLSFKLTPFAGPGKSAEAPPEIRHITRSFLPILYLFLSPSIFFTAFTPFRSGKGWLAASTLILSVL